MGGTLYSRTMKLLVDPQALRPLYTSAQPFPHAVIDSLFPDEVLRTVLAAFLQPAEIEGLIPDPYFGGAGPHQILPGGFLKVHVDFNRHPLLQLDRRLNLLVYLKEDWEEAYGGHLELWDREMTRCERKILPVFNRTVVFSTTDFSFHGHPVPLSCPEGRSRKSVSFYYYTNGRPAEERSEPHDTIFRKTHEHDW